MARYLVYEGAEPTEVEGRPGTISVEPGAVVALHPLDAHRILAEQRRNETSGWRPATPEEREGAQG